MSRDHSHPLDQAAAARALELERMCRTLGDAEASCDEVTRARAEARLEAALAAARVDKFSRRADHRWRWPRLAGLAMAAAAVVVAAIGVGRWRSPDAPTSAIPAVALARFEPYLVSPAADATMGAAFVPGTLTAPASRLDVPAGWLVRAWLSPAARVTIVGPAHVSVTGEGAMVRVRVDSGKLLGELVAGKGGKLEIVTHDSTTTVVGTLFSVDVGAADAPGGAARATRVSVAHGRVRVTARAATQEIGAGESWLTSDKEAVPISVAQRAELDQHHFIGAPEGPAVPLEVDGAPAGADVWLGETRVAPAPAWLRVDAHAVVRLSAPGHTDAVWRLPAAASDASAADGAQRPWHLSIHGAASGAPAAAVHRSPLPAMAPAQKSFRASLPDRPAPAAPHGGRVPPARPTVAKLADSRADTARAGKSEGGSPGEEPAAVPVERPAVPAPDAATMYHNADRAFAAGDRQGGRAALRELIARFPHDQLADAARYELAVMAHASGADAEALDELAAIDGGPSGAPAGLAEPVLYLRCRALVAQRSAAADACLVSFRQRYPRSAHAVDALGALAGLRLEREGCVVAAPLIEELTHRAPGHAAVASWRRACAASAGPRPRP